MVAHEWTILRSRALKTSESIASKNEAIKEGKRAAKQLQEEMKRIEKEVGDITKKRDMEMAKGGKVQTMDTKLKDLAKELAKTRMQSDLKIQTIADDEKKVVELEKVAAEVKFPPVREGKCY